MTLIMSRCQKGVEQFVTSAYPDKLCIATDCTAFYIGVVDISIFTLLFSFHKPQTIVSVGTPSAADFLENNPAGPSRSR